MGRSFAERHGGDDIRRLEEFSQKYGGAALIITRPLPLLAEACVLVTGASRMAWRRFLPPVLVSNLVISAAYAAVGAFFRGRDVLSQAVIASVLLPLAIAVLVRRFWSQKRAESGGRGNR